MSLTQWVWCGLTSAAILVGQVAPSSAASVLALDSTLSTAGTVQANTTWGWEFAVSAPVVVDALGFFDVGGDGLAESHQVWLWDATSEGLLASTTVTSGSRLVVSADDHGDWRLESIAPIVLGPGHYVIAAYYALTPGAGDPAIATATVTTIPEIAYVGVRIGSGFSVPQPFNAYTAGVFGPTLSVARASVPEPASFILLGLGLTVAARRAQLECPHGRLRREGGWTERAAVSTR